MPTAISSYTSKFKQPSPLQHVSKFSSISLLTFSIFCTVVTTQQFSTCWYCAGSTMLRADSSQSAEKSVNFMHQMALTEHKQTVLPDLEQNYNKNNFLKKIMTLFGKKMTVKSENGFPRTFLTKSKGKRV